MAKQHDSITILERGSIYFFHRPRAREAVNELQRSCFVLSPDNKKAYRLLAVARKEAPEIRSGEHHNWACVEKVTYTPTAMEDELKREAAPETAGGEPARPPARPAGEGVYVIARHHDHTHLAYALELREESGASSENPGLEKEASFVVSVKNPEDTAQSGNDLLPAQKGGFPLRLQEVFADRQFVEVDPPAFLDFEGAEILLIQPDEDVSAEFGIDLDPGLEKERTAEILENVRRIKSSHRVAPIFAGVGA